MLHDKPYGLVILYFLCLEHHYLIQEHVAQSVFSITILLSFFLLCVYILKIVWILLQDLNQLQFLHFLNFIYNPLNYIFLCQLFHFSVLHSASTLSESFTHSCRSRSRGLLFFLFFGHIWDSFPLWKL